MSILFKAKYIYYIYFYIFILKMLGYINKLLLLFSNNDIFSNIITNPNFTKSNIKNTTIDFNNIYYP